MSVVSLKDYVPSLKMARAWLDRQYGKTAEDTPYWSIRRTGASAWALVIYYKNRPGYGEFFPVAARDQDEALLAIYALAKGDQAQLASSRAQGEMLRQLDTLDAPGAHQKAFDERFFRLLIRLRRKHKIARRLMPVGEMQQRLAWQKLTVAQTTLSYWLSAHRGPNLTTPRLDSDELAALNLVDTVGCLRADAFCAFVEQALGQSMDPSGLIRIAKDRLPDTYRAVYPSGLKLVRRERIYRQTPIAICIGDVFVEHYFLPLASSLSELYWLNRFEVHREQLRRALSLSSTYFQVENGYDLSRIDNSWYWARTMMIPEAGQTFGELRAAFLEPDVISDRFLSTAHEELLRMLLVGLIRARILAWRNQPQTVFLLEQETTAHRRAMYRVREFLLNTLSHTTDAIRFPPRTLLREMRALPSLAGVQG